VTVCVPTFFPFCAVRIVSKESRRLILPRTFCYKWINYNKSAAWKAVPRHLCHPIHDWLRPQNAWKLSYVGPVFSELDHSSYIASNGRMTDEWGRILKEAVVAKQGTIAASVKSEPQSGLSAFRPRFEPTTFRIQVESVHCYSNPRSLIPFLKPFPSCYIVACPQVADGWVGLKIWSDCRHVGQVLKLSSVSGQHFKMLVCYGVPQTSSASEDKNLLYVCN
jgi:hypothetical protein